MRLPSREQLQSAGLYAIGLKRLHKWVEDDDEMIKEQKRKEKAEQQQEGKQAHDGYVRDKDRKRIRLPLETAGVSRERPPRFDFSLGKVRAHGGLSARLRAPTTDIDIPPRACAPPPPSLQRVKGPEPQLQDERRVEYRRPDA